MFDLAWVEKALELQKAMKEMTDHTWNFDKSWLDKAMEVQKLINMPGVDSHWYQEMLGGLMKGHSGSGIFNYQGSEEPSARQEEGATVGAGSGAGSAPAEGQPPGEASPGAWQPQFTITEAAGLVTLTAYIPGIKSKEDISIRLRGDTLYVSGRNQGPSGLQGHDGRALEFYRAVRLPGAVCSDGTSAHYSNGSLTVKIPKNRPVSVELDFKK
jgi:HSP20 family molecular chaperone IbpA